MKLGGTNLPLNPGPGNDTIVFGGFTDTVLRELPVEPA